jgi:ketosteroid isomerase-like protein
VNPKTKTPPKSVSSSKPGPPPSAAVRRKDMDGIVRHHAEDFLMFDVPPPFSSKGLADYEKTWHLFFSTSPEPPKFEIRELHITAGADVAFAYAMMRCIVIERGKASDLDFRLTIGFHKIAGQWIFTHEHHSIPAES